MKINFNTSGVCCREMNLEVDENNIITDVEFLGGCDGNLSGIARLIVGLNALDVAQKLEGTTCGSKETSCPDQLSKAIKANIK